jgi:hypothetical protein
VHLDYAPISAPVLAARENQLPGIPIRSYSRLIIINTWRAFSPPPQDMPLALCDSSSLPDKDIVAYPYTDVESGTDWKVGVPRYSPRHRWYYFPDLKGEELILFKSYDSQHNCRVAHAAFDNRKTFPAAKPRESVEARFFVYFD